ncbi:MAG TPA: TolC family protein, partial [Thermoanaerobaculia bacterium]|nr:TolC family protein [Thermoanaerobaculia bacterium]
MTALVLVAALAAGPAPVMAQEPTPVSGAPVVIDLERAVGLALAQNPALAAVEERRTEVAAQVREVEADAWPQLAGTSSYAVSRNPSLLNSPDFEDIISQFPEGDFRPGEQSLYSAGVEFSQPIYTFGKIGAAIELARVAVEATDAQIAAARLDVALDAAETYYDVLASREALAVGRVQTEVRRQALQVVEAQYEIGEATRLELLRAQAALAEVEPTVVQLAGDVEVAESRLRRALGLPAGAPIVVEGEMRVTIPPELAPGPGTLPDPAPDAAPPAADRPKAAERAAT